MYVFPEGLRLDPTKRVTYVGRFVGCLLLLSLILTLVILVLVLTKKFKPDEGLNNPDYIEVDTKQIQSEADDKSLEHASTNTPGLLDRMRNKKVHPEPHHHEGGDRRRHSGHGETGERHRRKTLKFKEDGPQYIPSDEEQHQRNAFRSDLSRL